MDSRTCTPQGDQHSTQRQQPARQPALFAVSWNWLLQGAVRDSSMVPRPPPVGMLRPMTDDQEYEAWARSVPPEITTDTIWRTPAYRFALFVMSRAQLDVRWLAKHRSTRGLVDQLLRAVGGISASIDEGYSRSSGPERAHFYEYALGSARESRGWYYKCSVALPPEITGARLARLSRIVRILTAIIPREREAGMRWRTRREPPDATAALDQPAATSSSSQQTAHSE
jgi:four helix bundle protein